MTDLKNPSNGHRCSKFRSRLSVCDLLSFFKVFNKFQKAKLSNGLFPRLDLVSYSNKLFSPSSHTQFESYVRDLNDLNHLMLRTHLEAINGDNIKMYQRCLYFLKTLSKKIYNFF